MKTQLSIAISILASLCLSGCQPSEAESLYLSAVQAEQQPMGDHSHVTVEAYRKVIRAAPNSPWAEKAQQRIDVMQRNIHSRKAARAAEAAANEARRTRFEIESQSTISR